MCSAVHYSIRPEPLQLIQIHGKTTSNHRGDKQQQDSHGGGREGDS